MDDQARIGFLFDEAESQKLLHISDAVMVEPYELMIEVIQNLYQSCLDLEKSKWSQKPS